MTQFTFNVSKKIKLPDGLSRRLSPRRPDSVIGILRTHHLLVWVNSFFPRSSRVREEAFERPSFFAAVSDRRSPVGADLSHALGPSVVYGNNDQPECGDDVFSSLLSQLRAQRLYKARGRKGQRPTVPRDGSDFRGQRGQVQFFEL